MHSYAAMLIKEGRDLTLAEQLLNEVSDIYLKTYNSDHLYFGILYKDLCSLTLKKDISKAIQHYNKAKEIIFRNTSEWNISYITMLIEIAEQLQTQSATGYEDITSAFINYFLHDFENVKELLGIYNSALHKGLSLTAKLLEEKGDKQSADDYRAKQEEFLRILRIRTDIRTSGFDSSVINSPDKESILSALKEVTSLPNDTSAILLEQFVLPFYNTYNLYRIAYTNSERITYKYALYNGIAPVPIDWTATSIYIANDIDSNLTSGSVAAYTIFFCDCIAGQQGKFYMLMDENDIPWRLDIAIDEKLKAAIRQKIKPLQVIAESDDRFTLQGFMLYRDGIFGCTIEVDKATRYVSMADDDPLHVYKYNDDYICRLDSEESQDNKNEKFYKH